MRAWLAVWKSWKGFQKSLAWNWQWVSPVFHEVSTTPLSQTSISASEGSAHINQYLFNNWSGRKKKDYCPVYCMWKDCVLNLVSKNRGREKGEEMNCVHCALGRGEKSSCTRHFPPLPLGGAHQQQIKEKRSHDCQKCPERRDTHSSSQNVGSWALLAFKLSTFTPNQQFPSASLNCLSSS